MAFSHFTLIRFPTRAPNGAATTLAQIITRLGPSSTSPADNLPIVAPIDEMNVMASEDAMVTLIGIFSTTSIKGTSKNAPAAPTTPDNSPTVPARITTSTRLNSPELEFWSPIRSVRMNIIAAAMVARNAYTRLMAFSER